MDHQTIHSKLSALCCKNGTNLKIETFAYAAGPRFEIYEDTLRLNTVRIPEGDYEKFACYYVLQFLMPRLRLETRRLILRPFELQDGADCFGFLSDPDGAYMDCCKPFSTMDEEYRERIRLFVERPGQYAIVLKESGTIIGTVNLFEDNSRAVDAMEIGYAISPNFQRQGYAFEAISALLHLVQEELGLDLVTAGILPENIASIALLKKLNFQPEGMRRKAVWHEGLGKPVDLQYFYREATCSETTG